MSSTGRRTSSGRRLLWFEHQWRYNQRVRVWWVWPAVLLHAAGLPAAAPARPAGIVTAQVSPDVRASLTREYDIEVTVRPHEGDAWTRLARRVAGDAQRWREIAKANGAGENLTADDVVRVPFGILRPELRCDVLRALFPNDRPSASGWRHSVIGGGVEGESLWKIAEWFTGDGSNYPAIRKANPAQRLSTHRGDSIVIPGELLNAAFRSRVEMEGENAASATAEVRKPADDPVQRTAADEDAQEAAVVEAGSAGQPSLTYGRDASGPYAVYRLQKGEALYSSVAIRFTGRVYADDVGEVIERIVKVNEIANVSRIHVGRPIRIPMDLLLPEYRPADDPTRIAAEESKRASARAVRRVRARNLTGVTVILDPGHGGRDVGTMHGDVTEARYVYDVVCRLRRILEARSGARVSVTTKSKSLGYEVADTDELGPRRDHIVLTTPRYELDDSIVGVNLRWYLANSIFGRAMKSGVPREKIVFLSVHADSLHPSLRGAMAYIPGQRYVQGSYRKTAGIYLARAEVRERPLVRHSEDESLEAEGLSRDLATAIIDQFDSHGLKVHPFNAVRDNVVRDGREWVPAVIRYNLVPTRALIEICNLGNRRDRELMTSRKWRENAAEAMYRGILAFYAGREPHPSDRVAANAGSAGK